MSNWYIGHWLIFPCISQGFCHNILRDMKYSKKAILIVVHKYTRLRNPCHTNHNTNSKYSWNWWICRFVKNIISREVCIEIIHWHIIVSDPKNLIGIHHIKRLARGRNLNAFETFLLTFENLFWAYFCDFCLYSCIQEIVWMVFRICVCLLSFVSGEERERKLEMSSQDILQESA